MSIERRIKWFVAKLGNQYVAILFLAAIFSALAVIYKDIWSPIFSIVIACIISDIISPLFLRGRAGITQITVMGNQTQRRGHAFVVFVVLLLIVGTIITQTLTIELTTLLNTDVVSALVLMNVVLIVVSYLDFFQLFVKR